MKLYADEPGADVVRALGPLVVSAVARVEVPAALWRKHRIGELSAEDAATLVEAFEWEWSGDGPERTFLPVGLSGDVLELAGRCVARHPLRALDAIQLGSALAARIADPDLAAFACIDVPLSAAALAEGFRAAA